MADFQTTKTAAQGRWPEILQYLGIPAESLTGKHCECAGCGGEDRFRYLDDEHGGWICGQGGVPTGGDGFNLLVHMGFSKSDALHAVSQYLGLDRVMYSPEQRQEIEQWRQDKIHADLDDGIFHEAHVLLQPVTQRKNNRDLEGNKEFRQARPEWQPYPKEVWERELLAAKRLIKMLEKRYDV